MRLQVTESAAAEKLKALRDTRGALLLAQRRVADAENRLMYSSERIAAAACVARACTAWTRVTRVRFARNCTALMGAGEFSTIRTANQAMIQATRQLMVGSVGALAAVACVTRVLRSARP